MKAHGQANRHTDIDTRMHTPMAERFLVWNGYSMVGFLSTAS